MTAMYTLRRGGAYDRFIMMIEALLERGCKVHCLSLTPISIRHKGYKNHTIRLPGKTKDTGFAKGIVLFFFPLYALWIGRQEKIDLFIAFGTLYAFIESLAKWILRKPMVTFLRGNFAFGMQTQGRSRLLLWLNHWFEKIGIHFSTSIISVNSTIQEEMMRATGRKKGQRWEVLPNNIPPIPIPKKQDISQMRKKYGVPESAKVLVSAGIITRGKNLELLIRSLPEIGLPNLFLLVAGDGATEADFQYKAFLKELVKDLELGNRVIFTGWLEKEDLWKILHGVDLFILPSKNEGMPNVMLEALRCDLPCMGSNIAGVKDILQYEELMFDPSDEKAIAKKIGQAFSNVQFFEKLKTMCMERKKVFNFDWKEEMFQMMIGGIF